MIPGPELRLASSRYLISVISRRCLESCPIHVVLEREGPLPRPCSRGAGAARHTGPKCRGRCAPRGNRASSKHTVFLHFRAFFFLLIVSTSGNVEIYFLIRRKKTLPTERPTRKDRPDEPSGFLFNNHSERLTALPLRGERAAEGRVAGLPSVVCPPKETSQLTRGEEKRTVRDADGRPGLHFPPRPAGRRPDECRQPDAP